MFMLYTGHKLTLFNDMVFLESPAENISSVLLKFGCNGISSGIKFQDVRT